MMAKLLQYFLLLPVLVLGIVAATHQVQNQMMIRPKCPPGQYVPYYRNASEVYDSSTENCCMGKVQPINRLEKCCGQGVYKPSEQLCCDGVAQELQKGFSCCGNTTYNTNKQICCAGLATDSENSGDLNLRCCDFTIYDATKQKCCPISANTSVVLNTEDVNLKCCGNMLYDSRVELCCSDLQSGNFAVYGKNNSDISNPSCCGSHKIDVSKQRCCQNTPYNFNEQTCCFVSTHDNDSTHANVFMTVVPTAKPGNACCGLSGKTYNFTTQVCCGNEVHDRAGGNVACCGNHTYNYRDKICSWNGGAAKPVKKESPDQNACCGDKPFATRREICCRKGEETTVHPKDPNARMACCGMQTYDTTSQLCCGEKLYDKSGNTDACCENVLYHRSNQTCCWNYDPDKRLATATLINEYKPGSFCCGTQLHDTSKDQGCCFNKVYDTKLEVCCKNKVINKNGNQARNECCWETPLNVYHPLIKPHYRQN